MSNFSDVLGGMEGGLTFEYLNGKLSEIALAVKEHHKVGELTLTVKVTPNGENAVTVTPAIKVKVPEASRGVTTYFIDDFGNLLRRDPRQRELALREVSEAKPAELRTAQ